MFDISPPHHNDSSRPEIRSWKQYRAFIQDLIWKGNEIFDEYNQILTLDELDEVVASERGGLNHTIEVIKNHPEQIRYLTLDPEGYSLSSHNFS